MWSFLVSVILEPEIKNDETLRNEEIKLGPNETHETRGSVVNLGVSAIIFRLFPFLSIQTSALIFQDIDVAELLCNLLMVSIVVMKHKEMTAKTWFVRTRWIISLKSCVMTQIDETQ